MRSITGRKNRGGALSWLSALAVTATLLIFAGTASAASGGGKSAHEKARQGEAIFHQRCLMCHNKQPGDTTPFGPPNLNGIFDGPTALKPQEAATIITNGKGRMPAFGQVLSRSDISAVIAYLKAH